jgi:hypothetical protein
MTFKCCIQFQPAPPQRLRVETRVDSDFLKRLKLKYDKQHPSSFAFSFNLRPSVWVPATALLLGGLLFEL